MKYRIVKIVSEFREERHMMDFVEVHFESLFDCDGSKGSIQVRMTPTDPKVAEWKAAFDKKTVFEVGIHPSFDAL